MEEGESEASSSPFPSPSAGGCSNLQGSSEHSLKAPGPDDLQEPLTVSNCMVTV